MLVSFNSKTNHTGGLCSQKKPAAMQPLTFGSNDIFIKSTPKSSVTFGEKSRETLENDLVESILMSDFDTRCPILKELNISKDNELAIWDIIKKHSSIVIDALTNKDEKVRWRAAEALGEIGDQRAVEPLTIALTDKESFIVRQDAAHALGKICSKQSIDKTTKKIAVIALIQALDDSFIKVTVAKALGEIIMS
jgi:hypothetical protein